LKEIVDQDIEYRAYKGAEEEVPVKEEGDIIIFEAGFYIMLVLLDVGSDNGYVTIAQVFISYEIEDLSSYEGGFGSGSGCRDDTDAAGRGNLSLIVFEDTGFDIGEVGGIFEPLGLIKAFGLVQRELAAFD
jgi:hypothetical protein